MFQIYKFKKQHFFRYHEFFVFFFITIKVARAQNINETNAGLNHSKNEKKNVCRHTGEKIISICGENTAQRYSVFSTRLEQNT